MRARVSSSRKQVVVLSRSPFARSVAATSGYNVLTTVLAAATGLLVARYLGPALRGEYAAVTSWFGLALVIGGLGQTAATCYFVAHDAPRSRDYVATSRSLMVASGTLVALAGFGSAPTLAHHQPDLTFGYRTIFAVCVAAFVGASYVFALQARSVASWNRIRTVQPVIFVLAMGTLWATGLLAFRTVVLALAASVLLQTGLAYLTCARLGLTRGKTDRWLAGRLLRYGTGQLTATAPSALNTRLDQLVMSVTVPPADLGRYAVAVSLTSLALPVVAALGYVAFPRLAGRRGSDTANARVERASFTGSNLLAGGLMVVLGATAPWLVPAVFGASFRDAVPLVWILAPGGFFLASGQVIGDLLRGRGAPWVVAHAQLAGALVTIVGLSILLPLAGAYGAAVTSTVSYGIVWLWLVVKLRQKPRGPLTGSPNLADDTLATGSGLQ